MKSENEASDGRNEQSGASEEAQAASPQTDGAHLLERIRQLEEDCRRERQARLAAEAERDSYHRSLAAMLLKQSTETDEDLDRLANDALRLTAFEEELRQLLHGP
jgi:hypothetical protein